MAKIKRIMSVFLVVIMVLGVITVAPITVDALYQSGGTRTISVGSGVQLSSNGGGAPYTWRTNNSSVVQLNVDKTNSNYCMVKGLRAGSATVYLYSYKLVPDYSGGHLEEMTESWFITVTSSSSQGSSLTFSKYSLKLKVGESKTIRFEYNFEPSKSASIVEYISNNCIDYEDDTEFDLSEGFAYGYVTIIGKKPGKAKFTMESESGDASAICNVTVKGSGKPNGISLNTSKVTLGVGESYKLKKTILPPTADNSCKWSSSNSSVAKVSKGKVTAKIPGTAYITAKTSNGKTAKCKITVKAAPKSVKIKPARVKMKKGKKRTISCYINSGSYANGSNIKWSTSNKKVATVKGKGKKAVITAKSKGTAYIKIKLYNGKTATCKVKVK